MCVRHNREGRCRSNPPSAAALRTPRTQSSVDTHFEQIAPSKHTTTALPPTPSSESTGDALHASPTTSGAPHHRREKPGAGRPPGSVQSSVPHGNYFEPAGHGSLADGGQSVALAIASRPHDVRDKSVLDEPASYWKHHLITVLPSQTQCEMLLSYFFENINWIYQTVHAPSLRAQHIEFWATDVEDVDLIWLALLYIILCLGAVFIPSQMAEAAGFEASDLPMLHRRWYEASRQALHAGGYDSKPTMTQLQVFLLSQLYWYGTKNIEALNSHIGLAVRNAQALGLDKEAPQSLNFLEREMRHRLWWDLVSSDT